MTTAGGAWVAVTAETGVYHNDAKLLDLAGDVSVFHDGGTEFHTTTAHVDLGAGSAAGDDPVDGQGPSATIKSAGFRLYDRGARIIFTGKAHLMLYRAEAVDERADARRGPVRRVGAVRGSGRGAGIGPGAAQPQRRAGRDRRRRRHRVAAR
ncbi:MAG: LPS export ABC transporter periplasmic protein LptC [Pseudomonadota bacterium]